MSLHSRQWRWTASPPNKAACATGAIHSSSLEPAAQATALWRKRQNTFVCRKTLCKAVAKSQPKELIYVIKKKTDHRVTLKKLKDAPKPRQKGAPSGHSEVAQAAARTERRGGETARSAVPVANLEAPRGARLDVRPQRASRRVQLFALTFWRRTHVSTAWWQSFESSRFLGIPRSPRVRANSEKENAQEAPWPRATKTAGCGQPRGDGGGDAAPRSGRARRATPLLADAGTGFFLFQWVDKLCTNCSDDSHEVFFDNDAEPRKTKSSAITQAAACMHCHLLAARATAGLAARAGRGAQAVGLRFRTLTSSPRPITSPPRTSVSSSVKRGDNSVFCRKEENSQLRARRRQVLCTCSLSSLYFLKAPRDAESPRRGHFVQGPLKPLPWVRPLVAAAPWPLAALSGEPAECQAAWTAAELPFVSAQPSPAEVFPGEI